MDGDKPALKTDRTDVPASIWQDALATYEKTTGRSITETNKYGANLCTVENLRDVIQQTDRNFSAFRNRHSIWGHLKTTLKPLQFLGNLGKSVAEVTPFAPASTILSAAMYLLQAAEGVSATYDAIEALLGDIGEITKRIEVHSQTSIDPNLEEVLTRIICVDLEILANAERMIKKRRIVEFVSTTFLGKDEKVQSLVSKLKKLTDSEVQMAIALINQTTRRIEKTGESILQSTGTIEIGVQENLDTMHRIERKLDQSRNQSKENEDKEKLLNLLGGSKMLERNLDLLESINAIRMPESGDWSLEDALFRKWKNQEMPLLWIFGQPGRGKTFLSSRIIDSLQNDGATGDSSVCYFFIKEDNQDSTSVDNIVRSIALQVAQNNPLFRRFLLDVAESSPQIFRNTAKFWKDAFLKYFTSPENRTSTFIVIDGLDEAPREERDTLISLLRDLEQLREYGQKPRLLLAVIGRPELQSDIMRCTDWEQFVEHIDVSTHRNFNDIQRYIKQEVEKVHILRSRRLSHKDKKDLKQTIVQALEEGANGMFQWVKLVLAEITFKKTKSDIIRAIHTAPHNLLEMVGHTIDRIMQDPDIPREYFEEMLCWIACAERPLTLREIETAMSTMPKSDTEDGELDNLSKFGSSDSQVDDDDDDDDDWNDWPDFETDLRTTFGSLMTLTRIDGKTTETLERELNESKASGHEDKNEASLDLGEASVDSEGLEVVDLPEFRSDKNTTIVQFSHASIRDFLFRKEEKLAHYYRIDRDAANARIATRLLGYFAGDVTPDNTLNLYYFWSMKHAIYHLNYIIHAKRLQLQDRIQILQLIHRAFAIHGFRHLSISILWQSLEYMSDDFKDFSQTLVSILIEWSYGDVQKALTEGERSWVSQAPTSTSILFKNVLELLGTIWLGSWEVTASWVYNPIMKFLHNCRILGESDPRAAALDDSKSDIPLYYRPDIDTITKFARWFNFEENGTWHARFGMALDFYGYYDAACDEYSRALELDPKDRRILNHLAEAYAKLDKVSLAIETSLKALQIDPYDNEDEVLFDLWWNIREWRFELGDTSGTIEAIKKVSQYMRPGDYPSANIQILYMLREHQLIMDIAKTLEERPLDGFLNWGHHASTTRILGYAAEYVGEVGWLDGFFQRVISQCRCDGDTWHEREQRFNYAFFLSTIRKDEKKAIALLKDLANEYLSSPMAATTFSFLIGNENEERSRQACYELLIRLYIQQGLRASTSTTPTDSTSELVSFVERLKAQSVEEGVCEYAYNAMPVWYKILGQPNKANECIRETVLGLIASSDDESWFPIYQLALKILWSGDKQNASIAFAAFLAECATPDSLTSLQMEQSLSPPFSSNLVRVLELPVRCSIRNCRREKQSWKAYFICEYCCLFSWETSGFCDECAPPVKNSDLHADLCDNTHSFLQIYPLDFDLVLKGAYVTDDGRIRPRAEWLESLRREWE